MIEPDVTDLLVAAQPDGSCRLLGHRCPACDRLGFPRAGWCGWCGRPDPAPVELGATGGTLFAWTEVGTAPPGYDGPVPYGLAIVELDEGIRVLGRLDGAVGVAGLAFGQRMRCVLDPLGVWAFAPGEAGR